MDFEKHQYSLFGPYLAAPKKSSEGQGLSCSEDEFDIKQHGSAKSWMSDVIYGCCVKLTPGKGLGLFAAENIAAGETILVEKPSLVHGPLTEEQDARFWCDPKKVRRQFANTDLVENFMKCSKKDQSDIMSLYNGHEEQFPSRNWHPGERPNGCTLVGKFLTNRFRISPKLTGVYFRCAFINHSCDSNCTFRILEASGLTGADNQWLTIEAARGIRAGDELTISYNLCDGSFEERQKLIYFWYGFRCVCSRCSEDQTRLYPGGCDAYDDNPLSNQRVILQQNKIDGLPRGIQGRNNMLTVVKTISGEISTIPKNGTVLEEIPLMLITKEELKIISKDSGQSRQDYHPMITRFLQLSAGQRNEFLALSNWRRWLPRYDTDSLTINDSMPSPEKLLEIWVANRFLLDDGMEGVFLIIGNLSHSCRPNCRVSWNPEKKTLCLIAMQPIKEGDQITICYDHYRVHELPIEKRQKFLRDNYGFNCYCTRCIKWGICARQGYSLRGLHNSQLPYKLSGSPRPQSVPSGQRLKESRKFGQSKKVFGGLSENETTAYL